MKLYYRVDEEIRRNRWRTDEEQMKNKWRKEKVARVKEWYSVMQSDGNSLKIDTFQEAVTSELMN